MKHLLCLMGQLCPLSNLYKTKLSAMVAVTTLFMCLIAAIQAPAQTGAAANMDEIQPLQIGDTIPEELWHLPLQVVNHPEGKETITLNDYRGKLIILDFWATWCAPCISSLYKLDTLQARFGDELAVIPTTYEQADKVAPFFAEKGWVLPTAVSQIRLKEYFPYNSIPHQVWLKDGKVLAIPLPEYANTVTIGGLLTNHHVELMMRESTTYENPPPIYWNFTSSYGLMLTKRRRGVPSTIDISSSDAKFQNVKLENLLFEAYSQQLSVIDFKSRIIYEMPDSIMYRFKEPYPWYSGDLDDDREYRAWINENTYCLNFISSKELTVPQFRQLLAIELNQAFSRTLGISVALEIREIECWVLRDHQPFKGSDIDRQANQPSANISFDVSELTTKLQYVHNGKSAPIINMVYGSPSRSLIISANLNNIQAVNSDLKGQGLELAKEWLPIECLVISAVN